MPLLDSEMSRKDFLKKLGFVALTLVGVSSVLTLTKGSNTSETKSFGSDAYGV